MIKTEVIEYRDGNTVLKGFYAYNAEQQGIRPVILVAHDWSGRNEFAEQKAVYLAELGYVGFAIDMYGEGKIGSTVEEKMALMQPLMADRVMLMRRINGAFSVAKSLVHADAAKVGAIGFCFGGLCVLDLARSGADVTGVVSFHGLLGASGIHQDAKIQAKILALHGHDDPMVPPDQVLAFENEMTAGKVDWQVHVFGNTKHAFSNPQAHDDVMGTVYNALAEKRSLVMMKNFFVEIFE